MSDNIDKMNFKQLRNEVQLLRDELAIMKRKYEDAIYNIDESNFSSKIIQERDNMKAEISVTADEIKTKLSKEDLDGELKNYSTITQTAEKIESTVREKVGEYVTDALGDNYVTKTTYESGIAQTAKDIKLSVSETYQTKTDAEGDYNDLNSKITVSSNSISAIISGTYTDKMFDDYLTGIEIKPEYIKMINGGVYSIYNSNGLRFYDSVKQIEGWAIEPHTTYGGVLKYYINNAHCYTFGTGMSRKNETDEKYYYTSTDMVIKAINKQRGRFVVDVTDSTYPEVKFVGLNSSDNNSPCIYANEKLLATQDWVRDNLVAKFG